MTHHLGAAGRQRTPAEAPGLAVDPLGQVVLLFRAGDGGVGGHQSGDPARGDEAHDLIQRVERQVRGDLDQHGLEGSATGQLGVHRLHRRQDVVEGRLVLELAQVGRVRGTDIDHEEIGQRPQGAERLRVFGGGLLQRGDLRFAQIDAHGMRGPKPLGSPGRQPFGQGGRAAVVETHAVDERLVRHVPEHPRQGIARLGVGGHASELAESEPERFPHGHGHALLVHAGGESDRIGEAQAEGLHRQRCRLEERLSQLA